MSSPLDPTRDPYSPLYRPATPPRSPVAGASARGSAARPKQPTRPSGKPNYGQQMESTAAALRQQATGGPRPSAPVTDYRRNREQYGQQVADTAEGMARHFSPVAQALAEARRRAATGPSNGAWMGNFIGNAVHGATGARARQASDQAAYTADGRRIGKPGTENIFDKQYTEEMKGTAQTVFDALNLDALTGDKAYNVGVETRRETAYGSADSLDRQASKGINPVRAREVMVSNTIAGGIADFQRMSAQQPDVYNTMVYRLWQAGLISGKVEDAGLGGWTPKAGKALANAMSAVSQLNSQGIPTTMDEYVDSLISGREKAQAELGSGSGGSGGAPAGPAPRQYTSREELNSRLKSTAQEVLGRALSDEEADKFASAFRGKEDGAYAAAEANRNYENPSASASAQTYVEGNHQTEAASFRIQGFMERLKSEMGL